MPFKSDKQRRYLFANEPELAREWANKYNMGGPVMGNDQLASQFVMMIQRQGAHAADMMLEQNKEMLSPEDYAAAKELVMRAMNVQNFNVGGPIEPIAQNKKGTFKAQATRMGMSIPMAARAILDAPEGKFSPEMRRKANFALNAQKWDKKNKGGLLGGRSEHDNLARVRRWLEELNLNPREEAWLLRRLGIDPVTKKNMGGDVPMYNVGGMLTNHPFEREGEQFDTVPAMLTPGEFVVDADSAHVFGDQLEQINAWEPGMGEEIMPEEEYLSEDEAVEIKRKFKDGTEIIVKSPEGSKTEVSGLLSSLTKTAKDKGYDPVKKAEGMNKGGMLYANPGAVVPGAAPTYGQQVQGVIGGLLPQQNPTDQARAQQLAGVGLSLLGAGGAGSSLTNLGTSELNRAATAAKLAEEKAATTAEESKVYTDQVSLAEAAILELNQGAGAVINFAISPAVTKLARAAAVAETRLTGQKEGVNIDKVMQGYIEDGINNYWGATSTELQSYYRLRQLANELRVIARKKIAGQGQVTEGEADVVYNTVFGFDQPSDTVAANLQALRSRAAAALNQTVQPVPYTSVESFTDKVTNASLGFIGDSAGAVGTEANPHKVPITKLTKASALAWLEEQDFNNDDYIIWKDIKGTVAELIAYLTRE